MRRTSVLFCLAATAGSLLATAPAAQAYPLCAVVWTTGSDIPNVSTGQTCAGWPYGADCSQGTTWNDNFDAYVHDYECIPAIV